jgi:hypothetical protein
MGCNFDGYNHWRFEPTNVAACGDDSAVVVLTPTVETAQSTHPDRDPTRRGHPQWTVYGSRRAPTEPGTAVVRCLTGRTRTPVGGRCAARPARSFDRWAVGSTEKPLGQRADCRPSTTQETEAGGNGLLLRGPELSTRRRSQGCPERIPRHRRTGRGGPRYGPRIRIRISARPSVAAPGSPSRCVSPGRRQTRAPRAPRAAVRTPVWAPLSLGPTVARR